MKSARFQIVRQLGEGGMAVVYEAIDTKIGEKRALKYSKAGHSHKIPPEVRAALKVTHENVCRVYEIHTEDGDDGTTDFISMELVEGETLADRWRREPLAQEEGVEVARQICRGVAAAHHAGVLHLDLKSANVMLTRRADGTPRAVVMDFGLARAFGEDGGQLAGTPRYMAPERIGGAEATPASDVYSLGVIFQEMLGAAADRRWAPILKGCLQADPAKRTSTAAAVLAQIEKAFAPSKRLWWLAAGVAVLGAGLAYFYWPEPPLARLAVLPFAGSTGDAATDEMLRGGLSEISQRLDSLGSASKRLVLIRREEAARYQVDTAEAAGGKLGATHVLMGSVRPAGKRVAIRAEVRDAERGEVLRSFEAEFAPEELAGISTSLAGVVTSAFRLQKALPAKIKPEAYTFYAQGLQLLEKDRATFDRAISLFDTAHAIDSSSPLVLAGQARGRVQRYRRTKDEKALREAVTAATTAERLHPDSADVLQTMGELQLEQGEVEKAIQSLERAGTLEPNRPDIWRRLGLALMRSGKDKEAVAAVQRAIQLAPGYFAPHQTLGAIHFQRGRISEAAEEYRIASELVPTQPEAHASYGGVLLAAERLADAEKALLRSLELRETRTALSNLSVLLRYQHRDAEAAGVLLRALRLDGKSTILSLNLGLALRRTGKVTEAGKQFERAQELAREALLRNPSDAAARAQLSYSQCQLGDKRSAQDNALQASRLRPNEYTVIFWATMTMECAGKRELSSDILAHATAQQLRDLRRQPDLESLTRSQLFQEVVALRR